MTVHVFRAISLRLEQPDRLHERARSEVIDEVGFQPMTRREASLFFRLVSYRYQRGSTLITTKETRCGSRQEDRLRRAFDCARKAVDADGNVE